MYFPLGKIRGQHTVFFSFGGDCFFEGFKETEVDHSLFKRSVRSTSCVTIHKEKVYNKMAHQLVCLIFLHTRLSRRYRDFRLFPYTPCRCIMRWTIQTLLSNKREGSSKAVVMMGCDERGLWVNSVPPARLSRLGKPLLICTKPT